MKQERPNRKAMTDQRRMSRDLLLQKISTLGSQRNQALAAFLALTGARAEEVVKYTVEISKTRTRIHTEETQDPDGTLKTIKKRLPAPIEASHLKGQPLNKEAIRWYRHKGYIEVLQIRTLKHKPKHEGDQKYRAVIIPINQLEKPLIDIFDAYCGTLQPAAPLFPISRQRVGQILAKAGFHPHFFRHWRATILATDYEYNTRQVTDFFDWSNESPAVTYISYGTADHIKKMQAKIPPIIQEAPYVNG